MTINDMIDAGISIEGEIEIRKWDSSIDDALVLFRGYDYELNHDASYMYEEISYMFAYKDKDNYTTVLCFELAN